jgi:hypothetical protein
LYLRSTCTQLSAELTEHDTMRSIYMCLDWSSLLSTDYASGIRNGALPTHHAFMHTNHATVLIGQSVVEKREWDNWSRLSLAIRRLCPKLASIRLVIRSVVTYSVIEDPLRIPTASQRRLLLAPPRTLAGLLLVQLGQGSHTEFDPRIDRYPSGRPQHKGRLVGAYLFGSADAKAPWWTTNQILEYFPPCPYPQYMLHTLPQETKSEATQLPYQIRGWVDKRGKDVEDLDGLGFDQESVDREKRLDIQEGYAQWLEWKGAGMCAETVSTD